MYYAFVITLANTRAYIEDIDGTQCAVPVSWGGGGGSFLDSLAFMPWNEDASFPRFYSISFLSHLFSIIELKAEYIGVRVSHPDTNQMHICFGSAWCLLHVPSDHTMRPKGFSSQSKD